MGGVFQRQSDCGRDGFGLFGQAVFGIYQRPELGQVVLGNCPEICPGRASDGNGSVGNTFGCDVVVDDQKLNNCQLSVDI